MYVSANELKKRAASSLEDVGSALDETRKDIAEGNVVEESVEDHIKRIQNEEETI